VQFSEGEFGVWDVDHGVRISTSSYLKSRDLRALDLDWLTPSHPVVCTRAPLSAFSCVGPAGSDIDALRVLRVLCGAAATSDGCVRVLDRSLSSSSSPILWEQLAEDAPLQSPALLGGFLPAMLKIYLLHPRCKVPRALTEALNALDSDTLQVRPSTPASRERNTTKLNSLLACTRTRTRTRTFAHVTQATRDPSISIIERCRRVATYFADEDGTTL
jgi:hypothetical protein